MEKRCPFHSAEGGVALSELPGIIRCGDRLRLRRALFQLKGALQRTNDLDEARGEALTFIAVVSAATLEMGASREMHRVQLESARRLDQLTEVEAITAAAAEIVERVCEPLFAAGEAPAGILIDRALKFINRNYSEEITDVTVAVEVGLSTSHFRHLFKEVTGQPFHKYLISLRLEEARRLLTEDGMLVSDAAAAVGFRGLAHFSRAFTQRFQVTPSMVRRGGFALQSSEA